MPCNSYESNHTQNCACNPPIFASTTFVTQPGLEMNLFLPVSVPDHKLAGWLLAWNLQFEKHDLLLTWSGGMESVARGHKKQESRKAMHKHKYHPQKGTLIPTLRLTVGKLFGTIRMQCALDDSDDTRMVFFCEKAVKNSLESVIG